MVSDTILAAFLAVALPAAAQKMYKWVDEKGVTHFSENPPPDGNPSAKQIEVKPIQSDRPYSESWKQKEAEARERRAKQGLAEEQSNKQEAQQRAQKCRQAQKTVDTMTHYARVFRLNEKGERVWMEENEKSAELADAKRDVAKYCD
jgi:hypothetical protein